MEKEDKIRELVEVLVEAVGKIMDSVAKLFNPLCDAVSALWDRACEECSPLIREISGILADAKTEQKIIDEYATRKEMHYMLHARKARVRKKYKNRVLRRATKDRRIVK